MSVASPERPLISVVIPTYQRASLLEQALASLRSQTLASSEFEVVVVDDGSSDWTSTVCARAAEEFAVRYLRIENSGISAAKNLGLFASRAPVILFFDDDDIADPGLLAAHVAAHREHPDEHMAVLGYTTWAPELEVTPLMEYVTDVGQQLFAYKRLEDRQLLDHTYFWGGRASCKRAFLARHGVFDQDFPAIIEDIELAFRLAKHGFAVVHARSAKSFMARAMTFDQFAQRCVKRGRALWLFNNRHAAPAVKEYCGVAEALERWPSLAVDLESKIESVRELEHRHSEHGKLSPVDLDELRGLYGWTFDALQAQGIAEAAAEKSMQASDAFSVGSRLPAICPDPVFIIGAPRSGTSILGWSLAQHSQLWTENESDIFFYLLKDGNLELAFERSMARPGGGWLGAHNVGLKQFLVYTGLGLNALFTATTNGVRWVDQTPANTVVVDRLAVMFPGAQFIHLLRDGRRVVHSMINFHRALGDPDAVQRMKTAGRLPPWATDFRDACQTWARFTGIASDFCLRHPDRSFTVANERLITDPEGAIRDLLEFLGVPHQTEPAHFLRTNRINSSFAPSGRAVGAPPTLTEPWKDWDPEQRYVFYEEAGEAMVARGLATEAELLSWGRGSDNGDRYSGAEASSAVYPEW